MSEPILVSGTDSSTDKVQTVVVNAATGEVVADVTISLKEAFGAKYRLQEGGFIRGDGGAVRIPYGLLTDGIDVSFDAVTREIEAKGYDRKHWRRMVYSLQQHGMGAWKRRPKGISLQDVGSDPRRLLSDVVDGLFSTPMATSWMDTSSEAVCQKFLRFLPAARYAQITGSAPQVSHRFLVPQATRLHEEDSDAFLQTEEFNVLASICATFLTGQRQGIGEDEASMTLGMNLRRRQWSKMLLRQCYPKGLGSRLPKIIPAGAELGRLWRYWVERHALSPELIVHMGFGDNIAADLTAGGVKLSLGSSGTFYQDLDAATYDPTYACHVLRNGKDAYMGMYVTDKCGKLVQRVMEASRLSWDVFNRSVDNPQWTDPTECVFVDDRDQILYFAGGANIAAALTRSILTDIHRRVAFLGKPPYIVATGGFAKPGVAKMAADIWGCPVSVAPEVNRVAYGSAIWSMTQATGRALGIVASNLCPTGTRIDPDPQRAYFYRQLAAEFAKRFPV
ncbi:MAG: hypothetical protein Q7S29_00735 [Candidatus Peribacter sp.]|nr:hypothetical protein [Candidatus Peribacter sp.]